MMLDGFADTLKIPTEVLNVLELPASFPMKSLKTNFGLLMLYLPVVAVRK